MRHLGWFRCASNAAMPGPGACAVWLLSLLVDATCAQVGGIEVGDATADIARAKPVAALLAALGPAPAPFGPTAGGPEVLHPRCTSAVHELSRALEACKAECEHLARSSDDAISKSSSKRLAARAEARALQRALRQKEAELQQIDAENRRLHDQLMDELNQLKQHTAAFLSAQPAPRGLDSTSDEAVDAWLQCEDARTRLQLRVDQC